MTASETVQAYFKALTAGEAQKLVELMSQAPHYVKIGTDQNEHIEGGHHAADYYQHHTDSTSDFTITFDHLDVQERKDVAWFYTRQTWDLKWQGVKEHLPMRMTGVLEHENQIWKFVQIHASLGVPSDQT